jgi:hypothetical protein
MVVENSGDKQPVRRAFMAACAGALIAGFVSNKAQAQTPITAFADIAGKWKGTSPDGEAYLDIEPSGKFTSESLKNGKDFGTAKIEGGQAILTFTKRAIRLQLSRKGDALEGSGVFGQQPFNIAYTRVGQ